MDIALKFIGFLLMGASDILYELRLLNKKKTQENFIKSKFL